MRETPVPSQIISYALDIRASDPPPNTDEMLMRIPGRNADRGEVTHKRFKDMNRKERRALLSGKK